ncbi:hypothetical protein [Haloarchaeobius amylolyticus]|uniref:hypothetical protein n=1 Tax=Haloarchaeobius amylolyticus TaxID=1198296 RepID=UPI002271B46D|nr:hypothetical protein [Haloarchaeobius amylolyticus]
MQRRRTYLAAIGTSIATAGCFGFGDSDGETDGTTPHPTDTPSGPSVTAFGDPLTAGRASVTLSKPAVQDSYFARLSENAAGVMAIEGKRFLFVNVESTGDTDPKLEDIRFEAGDYSARAWTAYESIAAAVDPTGEAPYTPENGSGWVGFAVPAPLEEDHLITLSVGGQTARTRLPEQGRAALAQQIAAFEVSNFSAPESASPGDTITVSVDVKNTNGTAGTFQGVVNGPDPKLFELAMDAGTEQTWSTELTAKATDEENTEMALALHAVGTRERATVSLGGN